MLTPPLAPGAAAVVTFSSQVAAVLTSASLSGAETATLWAGVAAHGSTGVTTSATICYTDETVAKLLVNRLGYTYDRPICAAFG